MILAEMIKLENTMCQRLERLFEREAVISHGLPLRNAAESVEHDTARKSLFRSLHQRSHLSRGAGEKHGELGSTDINGG